MSLNYHGKVDRACLNDNRQIAEKRLDSVTRQLLKVGKFEAYEEVFKEWLI